MCLKQWILLSCLIGRVHLLSDLTKQDRSLLAEDENPKCGSKDLKSFTCFWEAPTGREYYFLYRTEDTEEEKRCDVKQVINDKKNVLHICAFPPLDVYLYTEIHLKVVDKDTNRTVYSRVVSVEDQLLLDPPSNISLHVTGEAGQLQIKWQGPKNYQGNVQNAQYEVRYDSNNQTMFEMVTGSSHTFTSVAGENCTIQMRVKTGGYSVGRFWSDWSSPVIAMVPQTAEGILCCHTPDLEHLQCEWKEDLNDKRRHILQYRQTNRRTWESWTTCSSNDTMGQCVLHGSESSFYQFQLSAGPPPFSRTFYTHTVKMRSSIQTQPPDNLLANSGGGRLCLEWDCPLLKITQHLYYQIRYQHKEAREGKLFVVPSSKTSACLDVHWAGNYTIHVQARPNGSFYSGHWSHWSKPIIVHLPLGTEWIFIICTLAALFLVTSAVALFFLRYSSKIRQSLWPSVPNLNKMLENFLTDINKSQWEPTFSKQCDDDATMSVVEVLSEQEASLISPTCKRSSCLSLPDRDFLLDRKDVEVLGEDSDMAQDYVILNTNNKIPPLTGNDYVYGDVLASYLAIEKKLRPPPNTFPECPTNILNHSYLLLAEQCDLEERHYTNMEITEI